MLMISDAELVSARQGRFGAWLGGKGWRFGLLAVALVTMLIRARFFGNPIIDADEQFYLLAGDRMLHGALPYVDIWDRKPIGLFLIFAGIRLLGGDGVLAYQLVAATFAAATVVLIAVMARRIAPPAAALTAALLYAPVIGLLGGMGGQSPVFYNLPVAAAAWLTLRRIETTETRPGPLRWHGATVMLLLGLALQIKPTALFEGLFLGLTLLHLSWRRSGRVVPVLLDGLLWIAVALIPSMLAGAAYAALGHWQAYAYANFGSILARSGIGAKDSVHNLLRDLLRLGPLLVMILIGEWLLRPATWWHHQRRAWPAHRFLIGWTAAAVVGFLAFGCYFNHYALPLVSPLAILSAPAFSIRSRRVGPVLAAIALSGGLFWYMSNAAKMERRSGDAAYGYRLASRIRPLLGPGRCLYIFYGEPIYYHLTDSCLLTRWPFPYHLSLTREASALGIDPAMEMHRILAQRPEAILDADTKDHAVNRSVHAILQAALLRDYRLIYRHTKSGSDPNTDLLWQRLPWH